VFIRQPRSHCGLGRPHWPLTSCDIEYVGLEICIIQEASIPFGFLGNLVN
jgi:hypothetical protein